MKQAAKVMSMTVLVTAVLAGVVVTTGWIVHAQEPSGTPQSIEEKEAQAASLAAAGQHATAAALYEEVSTLYGDNLDGQRTAVESGRQYNLSNQPDKAIAMFDRAISNPILAEWREAALSGRAAACESAGMGQEALNTARQLMIEFPESSGAAAALDVKGRVLGMNASQLDAMKTKERSAAELVRQLRGLAQGGKADLKEGLQLAERIEAESPDTMAVIGARVEKGSILHSLMQYERSREVLAPVADELKTMAPGSTVAGRARSLLGKSLLSQAATLLEQGIRGRTDRSAETWKVARRYCDQVLAMNTSQAQVVGAQMMLVSLELACQEPAKAEMLADEYIQQYPDINQVPKPELVMVLYLRGADAARLNGKPEKALMLCEKVKAMYNQLPEGRQGPRERKAYTNAYYKGFLTMRRANVDLAETRAAGEEIIALFPGSAHAKAVQGILGLSAR